VATFLEDLSNARASLWGGTERTWTINISEATPVDFEGYYFFLPPWVRWVTWTVQVAPTFAVALFVSRSVGSTELAALPIATAAANVNAFPFVGVNPSQRPLVLRWPADSIPTARFRLETNVTDEPITVSVLLDSHRPGWSCEESEALRRLLGLAGCEHD